MRWDALFDDLAAQKAAMSAQDRAWEASDRARLEVGGVTMLDRIRPSVTGRVRIRCLAGLSVSGTLTRTGIDWLLVDEANGNEVLVRSEAVVSIHGSTRYALPPEGTASARLGVRHALRALARDRSPVVIELSDGSAHEGTIDRVGSDFIDLAAHAAGEARRNGEVREIAVVRIAGIVMVRRRR